MTVGPTSNSDVNVDSAMTTLVLLEKDKLLNL